MGESSMNLVLPIDANENYVPLDPIVVMEMVSMTEPDIQNLKRVLADNKCKL